MLLAIALVCFVAQVIAWALLPASADAELTSIHEETEGTETIAA